MSYKSYVVWNNKGGTGKTTLTFQLSTEYARLHPSEYVVVIDMCPQANVSSALLANSDFTAFTASNSGLPEPEKFYEKTVCGYLLSKLDREIPLINDLMYFLIPVHDTNSFITPNVYLMCGDLYLEVLSKRLEQERQLLPTRYDKPWKRVTLFIKDYIEGLSENGNYVFFIDTNPSFSIYTEMAISAAQRLIVPFTADDFSLSAIRAMLYLVYGYQSDDYERLERLKESQYFWLAQTHGVQRPMLNVRMFINNRTTYYNTRAASAFSAICQKVAQLLKEVSFNQPDIISLPSSDLLDEPAMCRHITHLHDFHSAGVVSLHIGCPISQLESRWYKVYDKPVQISSDNRVYKDDIEEIVSML